MEVMEELEKGYWILSESTASYGAAPKSHRDLKMYQRAFALAIEVSSLSKHFPKDELFALTSQIRRSSRSVCATITEACRKRRYRAAFIAKLSDAETEAAETQTWLEFAQAEKYMDSETHSRLADDYEALIKSIVSVINHADSWVLK
jgi:four helix bundle protein